MRQYPPLTEAQALAAWTVITEECGNSQDEHSQDSFVRSMTKERPCTEWRFQGLLGFGGKLYYDPFAPAPRSPLRVGYYPEHTTPERDAMVKRANDRLAAVVPQNPPRLVPTNLLIMRPEEPHETVTMDLPVSPGFFKLREILTPFLDGGDLEHVSVLADASFNGRPPFERADMFVDECGVKKGLDRNEAATLIYRRATLLGRSAARKPLDPEELPFIAGPAILFNRIVWT